MNRDEYRIMYEVEDRHWWYRGLRALVRQMWGTAPGRPEGPLLDIGCGTGGTLGQFSHELTQIERIEETRAGKLGSPLVGINSSSSAADALPRSFGADRSTEALHYCHERGLRRICKADAGALPYRDATFGSSLMLDVLYHRAVTHPVGVLREARRVLKPGGVIIVNVPAYEWLRSSHDTAVHTARRFTRPQLRTLLESAGFRIERCTYWNTIIFPGAASVRMARKSAVKHTSDLANYRPSPMTALLDAALRVERIALRVADLPFGLSVLAVGRAS